MFLEYVSLLSSSTVKLLHVVISLLLPVAEVGRPVGVGYGASNSKLAQRSDMAADGLWHGGFCQVIQYYSGVSTLYHPGLACHELCFSSPQPPGQWILLTWRDTCEAGGVGARKATIRPRLAEMGGVALCFSSRY